MNTIISFKSNNSAHLKIVNSTNKNENIKAKNLKNNNGFSDYLNFQTNINRALLLPFGKKISLNDDMNFPAKYSDKITDYANVFNFKPESILKAARKNVAMLNIGVDKAKSNVDGVVERFEAFGLTFENYSAACLKQSALFTQKPETIENNVKGVVDKFKDEKLNTKDYLDACLAQPQLFYSSPDKIESNVRDFVKKFKDDGLSVDDYLKACLVQPQLFSQSPDTIENNVGDVVKYFDNPNLTTKNYLPVCLKQPSLFCLSPETIEEHIKTLLFIYQNGLDSKIDKNDKKQVTLRALKKPMRLTCTDEYNFAFLLRKKMFPMGNPQGLSKNERINQKIVNYLRTYPNSGFSFDIKKDEYGKYKEFIEYAANLAKEAIGRDDIFNITVKE